MTQEPNYPERQFKARGGISSAIWRTQSTTDGETVDRLSIKVQKRYRDPATGEWRNSELYLFPGEVPPLLAVLKKAYEYCTIIDEADRSSIPV